MGQTAGSGMNWQLRARCYISILEIVPTYPMQKALLNANVPFSGTHNEDQMMGPMIQMLTHNWDQMG